MKSQFPVPEQQRVVRTTVAGMAAFSTQTTDGDGHDVRWYYVQLNANELLEISENENDRRATAILRSLTISRDVR